MKNALITGASSEIGIAIAKILEVDYNLILIKHISEIDICNLNRKPIIYTCDFNDELSLNTLLKKIKDIKVDLLINIAAYDQNEIVENLTSENFISAFKINALTPFLLTQNLFNKEDKGIIINIASTDGIDTYNEYNFPYATSKAALIHISKQIAYCYPNLNVYTLCPNYINTKTVKSMEPNFLQNELKRVNQNKLIEVEDISAKIEEILKKLPNNNIIRME